jgi:BirA family biotin operon repressor/biotin-[acetyl-CoA-carboxylase] ligase
MPIGSPFIELQSVDSTNNYAMGMVHAGMAQGGTAVFAHAQTKGRGQRGRSWHSDAASNIALSLIIDPKPLAPTQLFLLSKCIAVAVLRFFNRYATSEVTLKWPNDLYWRDRKAGGILIENVLHGPEWRWAIAGIGLNINQTVFPEAATRPVSLKQITGRHYDPPALAKELCAEVDACFRQLLTEPQVLLDQYQQHLFRRGEKVRLRSGRRVFEATILGVTNAGELVVQHALEERFAVGEVEWVL